MCPSIKYILASTLAVSLLSAVNGVQTVFASPSFVDEINTHLYTGHTAKAAAISQQRLLEAPGDDQALFALGTVQFLQAVENLGQSFYRYGLRSSYGSEGNLVNQYLQLPILRLPVPENPDPEKITYSILRGILDNFVNDLARSQQTLSRASDSHFDYPLNFGLIRLDLNGDGITTDEESLWRIFKRIGDFTWLDEEAAKYFMTDFDSSDLPWLRAYSHLLMAISEFFLAHDWQVTFEMTFHGLFAKTELPLSGWSEKMEALLTKNQHQPTTVVKQIKTAIMIGNIADLVAFVHLNHWPVVAPERMVQVLGHLEAVVALSRENWKRILAETDDMNEWIPSPKQSGVLPNMGVSEEQVKGWALFLDEFEAVLLGKKLIPHWRSVRGINLRQFFLEPTTFDIVLLIQGSSAVPYLEEGEQVTSETWTRITRFFRGDFFRYAFWFN